MWTINSNDVLRAKDRLLRRRTEIEARYADEQKALDAEFAAIDTLERVAAEFAVRHVRDDPGLAVSPPSAQAEPPGGGEPIDHREEAATAPAAAAEPDLPRAESLAADPPASEAPAPDRPAADPPAADEAGGAFDILKPGSRWRLNRAARPSNPESPAGGLSPTTW